MPHANAKCRGQLRRHDMKYIAEIIKTSTITVTAKNIRANGFATVLVFAGFALLVVYDKL